MKRFVCGLVVLTFGLALIGCGDDKPKSNGLQGDLKPMPPPGSPGGDAKTPKGKPAAPGGGASTG